MYIYICSSVGLHTIYLQVCTYVFYTCAGKAFFRPLFFLGAGMFPPSCCWRGDLNGERFGYNTYIIIRKIIIMLQFIL